jgi:hypothetical protein
LTFDEARKWLILFTLCCTGANFLFFLLSPVLGFPLEQAEAIRVLEIVLPIFLGYLGTATQFLFQTGTRPVRAAVNSDLLSILVRGPAILFAIISVATIVAFGYANRRGGRGMTPDTLSAIITINLSLLAVTTNVIISNLFPVVATQGPKHSSEEPEDSRFA